MVVGLLAVASVVGIALRDHPTRDGTSNESAPPSAAAPISPRSATVPDSASNAWHDGAAEQILELEQRVEQLEVEAAHAW
jgi:hypothetical protein